MKVEIAYQLYVLQTLFLGLLEQRMNTKMDSQDQESQEKIKVSYLESEKFVSSPLAFHSIFIIISSLRNCEELHSKWKQMVIMMD